MKELKIKKDRDRFALNVKIDYESLLGASVICRFGRCIADGTKMNRSKTFLKPYTKETENILHKILPVFAITVTYMGNIFL